MSDRVPVKLTLTLELEEAGRRSRARYVVSDELRYGVPHHEMTKTNLQAACFHAAVTALIDLGYDA